MRKAATKTVICRESEEDPDVYQYWAAGGRQRRRRWRGREGDREGEKEGRLIANNQYLDE